MKSFVLIACVRSKLNDRAKAKDLYTSTLFKSSLLYARLLKPDAIYILSAKYRLLDPDQMIDPYELTLNTMAEAEKMTWSREVLDALRQKRIGGQIYLFFLPG